MTKTQYSDTKQCFLNRTVYEILFNIYTHTCHYIRRTLIVARIKGDPVAFRLVQRCLMGGEEPLVHLALRRIVLNSLHHLRRLRLLLMAKGGRRRRFRGFLRLFGGSFAVRAAVAATAAAAAG